MKRISTLLLLFAAMLWSSACTSATPASQATPTPLPAVDQSTQTSPETYDPWNACDNFFLPLHAGTTLSYSDGSIESIGPFEGESAQGTTFVNRMNADGSLERHYIQCANGKTEIVKIATLDKDMNETGVKTMQEISGGKCESKIVLPEAADMIPGKAWDQCGTSCHVVNDPTITIELGTFKTRRVDCEDGVSRWYAPQFGLLKTCSGKDCTELIRFQSPD